jgi:hypothetical protein
MPKFVSRSNAAAQWAGSRRNASFFAEANNYLLDVIIMNVEPSGAVRRRRVADDDRVAALYTAFDQNGTSPPMSRQQFARSAGRATGAFV